MTLNEFKQHNDQFPDRRSAALDYAIDMLKETKLSDTQALALCSNVILCVGKRCIAEEDAESCKLLSAARRAVHALDRHLHYRTEEVGD